MCRAQVKRRLSVTDCDWFKLYSLLIVTKVALKQDRTSFFFTTVICYDTIVDELVNEVIQDSRGVVHCCYASSTPRCLFPTPTLVIWPPKTIFWCYQPTYCTHQIVRSVMRGGWAYSRSISHYIFTIQTTIYFKTQFCL